MGAQIVGIQPKVLRWAKTRAGYSVEDIASKLKRDPALTPVSIKDRKED
jgi:hypothetical protein